MTRIFISYSSHNSLESVAFRDWLLSLGYAQDDIFLDLHSLGAGDRWREALRAANRRCEAVILLASPEALCSEEVRREIMLAGEYGKPLLVCLLDGLDLHDYSDARLTPYRDRQMVDLAAAPKDMSFTVQHEGVRDAVHFNGAALAKIKGRLEELGLEAASFPWAPENPDTANPYPGLRGFTEKEAGLFFGRDPEIARGLAALRALRTTADGRLLVVQAASGAGKSSYLKAGLWPRLRRDGDFDPIEILRPAGGIISGATGLARALTGQMAARRLETLPPAAVAGLLLNSDIDTAYQRLSSWLSSLDRHAKEARRVATETAQAPALVFGIDQGEELFAAADLEESERFMALLKRLADEGPIRPIFVLTLRADSFGALLRLSKESLIPALDVLALPPIPREAYIQIIQEPARVAREAGIRLELDSALVQQMIDDSRGSDALPLLSVMLEQLIEDHRIGREISLSLEGYHHRGGVEGALGARLAAAQRDAGQIVEEAAHDETLKQLMAPSLASWDAESDPPSAKRLVALEQDLIGDAPARRQLAKQMVEKHLLRRTADEAGDVFLEVAHEALLRQSPISDWLEADKDFLAWRETVDRARKLNDVNIGQFVFGEPLERVEAWLTDRESEIPSENREFVRDSLCAAEIRAQKELEEERRKRALQAAELKAAQEREAAEVARAAAETERADAAQHETVRMRAGLIAALAIMVMAMGAGAFALHQVNVATQQEREALRAESRALAKFSQQNAQNNEIGDALALARLALPRNLEKPDPQDRPVTQAPIQALYDVVHAVKEERVLIGHEGVVRGVLELRDGRLLTWSDDDSARIWPAEGGAPIILRHEDDVLGGVELSDGRLLTWSRDDSARIWPAEGGEPTILRHEDDVWGGVELSDGRLLTWSSDDTARIWPAEGGEPTILRHEDDIEGSLELSDGRLLTWSLDDSARIWPTEGGEPTILRHMDSVWGGLELKDGRLLTWGADDSARIWPVEGGEPIILRHEETALGGVLGGLELSDGRLLTWSRDNTARIWSAEGDAPTILRHESVTLGVVGAVELDNGRLLTWSSENLAWIWSVEGGDPTILRHEDSVWGGVELSDGRLLTWSGDYTARIWPAEGGEPTILRHENNPWSGFVSGVLRGAHTWGGVIGGQELSGGRLLTWSDDNNVRVWPVLGGEPTVLRHGGDVEGGLELSDGRLITWSADDTARIWPVEGGDPIILRHEDTVWGGVRGGLKLSDGRLLTWSDDDSARIWPAEGGAPIILRHEDDVLGGGELSDGRLLTWSTDDTARIWPATGGEATILRHEGDVGGGLELSDGRLLTWSADNTARIWPAAGGEPTILRHEDAVLGGLELKDGRLLTWSVDDTARIWPATGSEGTILRHKADVGGGLELSDGRLLTWSADNTARIWPAEGGEPIILRHDDTVWGGVLGGLELSDGRLLTWSADNTARIWPATGGEGTILRHKGGVLGGLELSDGRLLTWSADDTARIWPARGGEATVLRHEADVEGGLELNDGRLLTWSSDDTARIWPGTRAQLQSWADGYLARAQPLSVGDRCEYFLEDQRVCALLGESEHQNDALNALMLRGGAWLAAGDSRGDQALTLAVSRATGTDREAEITSRVSAFRTAANSETPTVGETPQ